MQPTKFQLNFWNVVKTALEYRAMTKQESRLHRKNFWVYNREEHAALYSEIMERILFKMHLEHLKSTLKYRRDFYKRPQAY
ncbi:hypothetical protein CLV24_13918 [Pontibacter ummariensis]|uniref:Uncharacterized protein n=1 Tax=Pontibacter ummariensis TaxID=1610492 RepID=A0A239LCV4_9BACT|nr:hypothetical protein CLV24_13918 [Pontibacter ummariensis]SNT28135.1 hypothetical protein SAMN06296052_13914 [Pontibacter ummariensis]